LFKRARELFVAIVVVVIAFCFGSCSEDPLRPRPRRRREREGAVVLGFSPTSSRNELGASTVITGLLGIFVASINSTIEPIVIPALIVPALTAALVGSFSSRLDDGRRSCSDAGDAHPIPQRQRADSGESEPSFPRLRTAGATARHRAVLFLRGNALPTRGDHSGRLPFARHHRVGRSDRGPHALIVAC
jgi:branched-chain amino acid transport system permease protein